MTDLLLQWSALLAAAPRKSLGLAAWLLVLGAVFGVLERWRPIRPQHFLRRHLVQDIGCYFLGSLLPPFVTVLVAALVARGLGAAVPGAVIDAVGALPLGLRVGLMLVLGDLAFYAAHRASHRIGGLWRLHAVHHSPTELDWLANTRAHPLDLAFARAVSALPLLVLGLRQPGGDMQGIVVAMLTLTTLWGFVVHANLRWRLGWLEQLIVTPAFHHWHHADGAPSSPDRNYASLFPWIDRLFGTFHLPADRWPASYGAGPHALLQDGRATASASSPQISG